MPFLSLTAVKRTLTLPRGHSREQKPPRPLGPPLPCDQQQWQPTLTLAGLSTANTCFKDIVHVPLFNTARLLRPPKSWISPELPSRPLGEAGLTPICLQDHLLTLLPPPLPWCFPQATKALGLCRTTVKSQGDFCNWAAWDLCKTTNFSGLAMLLSAMVMSKQWNC